MRVAGPRVDPGGGMAFVYLQVERICINY